MVQMRKSNRGRVGLTQPVIQGLSLILALAIYTSIFSKYTFVSLFYLSITHYTLFLKEVVPFCFLEMYLWNCIYLFWKCISRIMIQFWRYTSKIGIYFWLKYSFHPCNLAPFCFCPYNLFFVLVLAKCFCFVFILKALQIVL